MRKVLRYTFMSEILEQHKVFVVSNQNVRMFLEPFVSLRFAMVGSEYEEVFIEFWISSWLFT